jgi:hypothetical protein
MKGMTMKRPPGAADGSVAALAIPKGKMPRKAGGGPREHAPLAIPTAKMPRRMGRR